jgi:hypothetical protein
MRHATAPQRKGSGDFAVGLLPHQVELGWVRSGGTDRYGVTLAWGL